MFIWFILEFKRILMELRMISWFRKCYEFKVMMSEKLLCWRLLRSITRKERLFSLRRRSKHIEWRLSSGYLDWRCASCTGIWVRIRESQRLVISRKGSMHIWWRLIWLLVGWISKGWRQLLISNCRRKSRDIFIELAELQEQAMKVSRLRLV